MGVGEEPKRTWKSVVPWLGVLVVLTMNTWFQPLYRAVPTVVWVVAVFAVLFFGVRQWIVFFWRGKPRE